MVLGYKMNDADDPALIVGIDAKEQATLSATGRVEEIVRFIESRYVDEVNDDQLVESAIVTVLDQLDPHSVYIAPEYLKNIHDTMEGSFKGVGIVSYFLDDTVNIISVIEGSPASEAGIEQFDQIIAINDSIVAGQGLEFNQISDMLRSDEASKKVKIIKGQSKSIEDVTLHISDIPLNSVEAAYMLNEETGIIKLVRFSSQTYKEFMEALEDLVDNQGLKNLVIDLRDNPGGYLPEATNILSQLMREKDRLLVYTEGKNNSKTEYKSTGKSFFNINKVALIIDENSASGSEILAGAIQDWDRGLIIGRRTFGKGLVQEQYDLSNGGAIRLTVARYYTPTGRSIQQSYDDLTSYHDVTNRYHQDTVAIPDSLTYNTLLLNRKVYGGGGIFPDVYVPISAADEDPGLYNILDKIPEWTYRKVKDGTLSNTKVDDKSNVMISEEDLAEFSAYLNDLEIDYAKGYLTQYKQLVVDRINQNYIRIKDGDEAYYKQKSSHETEIEMALDYTSSSKSLKEYLEEIKE